MIWPNAATLLELLNRMNIRLKPERNGMIRIQAHPDSLTQDLRRQIKHRRRELIILLGHCPECAHSHFDRQRSRCFACGHRDCQACGRPTGAVLVATCILCQYGTTSSEGETSDATTTVR